MECDFESSVLGMRAGTLLSTIMSSREILQAGASLQALTEDLSHLQALLRV